MCDSPLTRALQIQQRAASQGFDWNDLPPVWDKLDEEIRELRQARGPAQLRHELGDVLLAVVNLARWLSLNPDAALQEANERFIRRFAHVMATPEDLPTLGDPARLAAMERRWQEAKRMEAARSDHT